MAAGTVGAELATMQALHKIFTQKAQEALEIKTTVDGSLQSAVWTGHNAQSFHTAWVEYRRNLDNLHTALIGAADDVRANHNNIAAATGESDRI
jgi:uncharacterized protein YukE